MVNPREEGISHSPQGSTRREFLTNVGKGAFGAGLVLMAGSAVDIAVFSPLPVEEGMKKRQIFMETKKEEIRKRLIVDLGGVMFGVTLAVLGLVSITVDKYRQEVKRLTTTP